MHIRPTTLTSALAVLANLLSPAHAEDTSQRYVQASELRLRATAQTSAATVTQLRINEPVGLVGRDGGWCRVKARGDAVEGWADCAYLAVQPISLEQTEREIAAATLALHRAIKPIPGFKKQLDSSTVFVTPAAARSQIETLFAQLERHFALSPSVHTLADYDALLQLTSRLESAMTQDPALAALVQARRGSLTRLRRQLVQTDTRQDWPSARQGATAELRALMVERAPGQTARGAARRAEASARAGGDVSPASGISFFREDIWAVGWAGGPLVQRQRDPDTEGVVYKIRFDGPSYRTLAGLFEMAKTQRVAAKAEFKAIGNKGELAQMASSADGGADGLVLNLRLPIWGITADGLVAGTLRSASYGGDECSDTEGRSLPTEVEVVFPQRLRRDLHGIFATNGRVDPSRARVAVRQRTFLSPLQDAYENTLTHRVDMRVDLDGDGVDDLRTVVSQDTSVGRGEDPLWRRALARNGLDPRWLRPAAGWYAYDVYMLQANFDGWWRPLSLYNVVTCT